MSIDRLTPDEFNGLVKRFSGQLLPLPLLRPRGQKWFRSQLVTRIDKEYDERLGPAIEAPNAPDAYKLIGDAIGLPTRAPPPSEPLPKAPFPSRALERYGPGQAPILEYDE